MDPSASLPRRTWLWRLRILGTVGSLTLLGWLMARQDWEALLGYARRLPALSLALGLGLTAITQLFNVGRWWALLRGQKIRLGYFEAARLAFAGLFASNFLPSTIGGDVVRILGATRASRSRLSGAATVAMDRAVSVFSMLFLLPFSGPLIGSLLGRASALAGSTGAMGAPPSLPGPFAHGLLGRGDMLSPGRVDRGPRACDGCGSGPGGRRDRAHLPPYADPDLDQWVWREGGRHAGALRADGNDSGAGIRSGSDHSRADDARQPSGRGVAWREHGGGRRGPRGRRGRHC